MTTFRTMTWNVENLFRPPPGAPEADQRRYQRKLALLAAVIAQADPDVSSCVGWTATPCGWS